MNRQIIEQATFAGGCFWCIASALDGLDGILKVVSGYTGGRTPDPTYEQVTSGLTGHYEAVQVTFDAAVIRYSDLVRFFFQQIDPTDATGSFVDRGSQYRSAVFYHNDDQKKSAEAIVKQIDASRVFDRPVATAILEQALFYEAETYHQDYHQKNPVRYRHYRTASGRDAFIEKVWKKGMCHKCLFP